MIDNLNLIYQHLKNEKNNKINDLSQKQQILFQKENEDNIFNEIQLLSDTPIGLKVLCARYSMFLFKKFLYFLFYLFKRKTS